MRILKKLIALTAVAACVLTMGGPMLAKADDASDVAVCAVSGCKDGNHLMGKQVYQGTTTSTTTHEYSGGICTITTTYNVYLITCECGAVSAGTTQVPKETVHSSCGQ